MPPACLNVIFLIRLTLSGVAVYVLVDEKSTHRSSSIPCMMRLVLVRTRIYITATSGFPWPGYASHKASRS